MREQARPPRTDGSMNTGSPEPLTDHGSMRGGSRWRMPILTTGMAAVTVACQVALSGPDMLIGRLTAMIVLAWVALIFVAAVWDRVAIVVILGFLPVAMPAVGLLGLPAMTRAAASETALAAAYDRVAAGQKVDSVGFYRPEWSHIDPESRCAVFVTFVFILDESGVAYCPHDRPPRSDLFSHLFGNVYSYNRSD